MTGFEVVDARLCQRSGMTPEGFSVARVQPAARRLPGPARVGACLRSCSDGA